MKKNVVNIGVDVGNYDTKTPCTSTPSGFVSYRKLPYGVNDYIQYDGNFYIPDTNRFPYVYDKTQDTNCFILSLMAIGKELIEIVKNRNCPEGIQAELDKIDVINLGVGLPPIHYAQLAEKTLNYYQSHFGEEIQFKCQNYNIKFKLGLLRVYPQDYAAVCTYQPKNEDSIVKKYKSYYALDLGGYTLDIVFIVDGAPNMRQCDSKPLGILSMYEEITRDVQLEYGIRVPHEVIENVLRKEETILESNVIEMINQKADDFFERIINELRQFGLEFESYPVIFVGGGALLFKSRIKECGVFKCYEFIPGTNANAKGYKKLIGLEYKSMR